MAHFGLKLGQDLGNREAHPYRKFRGVPPRAETMHAHAAPTDVINSCSKNSWNSNPTSQTGDIIKLN